MKSHARMMRLRNLSTSRVLLKPSQVEDIEQQIRAAAEQLANLRKARAVQVRAAQHQKTEDANLASFLMKEQQRQAMGGAEGGRTLLTSLSSLTSLSEPMEGTAVQQAVRAWDGCTATSHVAYALSDDAFIFHHAVIAHG